MKKIVIIGAGFAGLWSAFGAMRLVKMHNLDNEIKITLINKDRYHGLRPRFYEYDLNSTRIPLENYLAPLGINLAIGEVSHIDHITQEITLNQEKIPYDRLILATGSHLYIPDIPGFKEHAFNIDTYAAANKLKAHIEALPQKNTPGRYTMVIAGGSFTGIEAATDLIDRLKTLAPANLIRVIIIDRSEIASRFSPEMRKVILTALDDMGIETLPNVQINNITAQHIELSSGEIIATQTVIWTAGMQANPLTKKFGVTLDHHGRLPVDRHLKIQTINNCFAAGDVAAATTDGTHTALFSCQHAMPQGRFAGHNATADLLGKELLVYEQVKYVTCLDLGSWGAIYSEEWDQRVISIKESAKKIKLFINHERIYPPIPTAENVTTLLEAAEPIFKPMKLEQLQGKIA